MSASDRLHAATLHVHHLRMHLPRLRRRPSRNARRIIAYLNHGR